VVIGSYTSASLLDLFGGPDSDTAARRLIEVGLAATPLTALTGVSDWADAEPASDGVRRVGMVHAATNGAAAGLYVASLLARRRGRRGTGAALALAGAGVLAASGWLGGHLSYQQGIGTDQTRFDAGPAEWTTALDDAAALREGEPHAALAGDTPVLLVRRAGRVLAIHNRCSHRGCELSDGEIADSMVTCACHGSRFSLEDGTVLRGPATSDQPAFDVREQDGRVDVRLRPRT
jgi:nitrite reductase/ring-hydroxylating ferredoxin subunit